MGRMALAWFRCGRGVETITYTEKFDIEYKKISEAELKAVVERHVRYVNSRQGGSYAGKWVTGGRSGGVE